nr:MAG TPA: hypothetical protein [Caudoviricetes sp.]
MKDISMKLIFCLVLKIAFSVIVNTMAMIITKWLLD